MKWKFLVLVFFAVSFSFGQQNYFVLIENAAKQAFSVSVNNKVFSGSNYITIPKLSKGSYEFKIEVNAGKSASFLINIEEEDKGFVLKETAENGLVLFDVNTFKTLTQPVASQPVVEPEIKKTDFVKPPNITTEVQPTTVVIPSDTKPVEVKDIQKPVTTPAIVEPPKEELKLSVPTIEEPKKEAINTVTTIRKETSRKIFENTVSKGIDRIYVVENGNKLDTISVFIPQLQLSKQPKETPAIAEPAPKVTATAKPEDASVAKAALSNGCTSLVGESYFNQLLQLISNETNDKNKLDKATGFLNKDCFTTNQIKQIGSSFNNDYYKFEFYRSAKKFIADMPNFSSLKETIKEEKVQELFADFLKN